MTYSPGGPGAAVSAQIRSVARGDPGQPNVREFYLRETASCRCGSHLGAGDSGFEVLGVPSSGREIFDGRTFCSVRCIRAFCLESLEALDVLDTPRSRSVVTDLHDVYQGLAEAFAKILLSS